MYELMDRNAVHNYVFFLLLTHRKVGFFVFKEWRTADKTGIGRVRNACSRQSSVTLKAENGKGMRSVL